MPVLNEAMTKNRKIMPFHKRADKRLSDVQKGLVFATSAVLEIADELILDENERIHRMKTEHLSSGWLCFTLLILLP